MYGANMAFLITRGGGGKGEGGGWAWLNYGKRKSDDVHESERALVTKKKHYFESTLSHLHLYSTPPHSPFFC